MPRRVTLVLCSPRGRLLGTLPPIEVASPWWPDVEPVVAAARDGLGAEVTVLRLLTATGRGPDGGHGAYLAEVPTAADRTTADAEHLAPWLRRLHPPADGDPLMRLAVAEDPLRLPWARPGGVAADVAWADRRLAEAGVQRVAPPVQVKSWNLSSVLRLATTQGDVWLKTVPPFLGPEGRLLATLGRSEPDLVPAVVARTTRADGCASTLLRGVPGTDQWEASEPVLAAMLRRWVAVQARWADRIDELVSLALPDWRSHALLDRVRDLALRTDVRATLADAELAGVDALVEDLPEHVAALDACGLPATLVHGDLHPGNWISDGERLVLVDWGDSGIGHPLLDAQAFLSRVPAGPTRQRLRAVLVAAWERHRPGADVRAALALVEPISALRGALVYRAFLDGIETSEQPYHADDVPEMLRLALTSWDRAA